MADLNRLLADNLALVVGLLALVSLFLIVLALVQGIRLGRAVRSYRQLVRGGRGGSLDEVLGANVGRVEEVGNQLNDLLVVHELLERRSRSSIQHIGLVRFNPFDDTGSDQSFAIALLDDQRDGIVISSLHGRANTRVFAKPVEKGASRHNLSDEESQAIRIAVEGTSAPAHAD